MKSYTVHYNAGLYNGSTGNGMLKFNIKFNVGFAPEEVGWVNTSLRVLFL
jgi:hypothetical protein